MDDDAGTDISAKPTLQQTWSTFLAVSGPAFAWFGAQVAWCLQDAFATPYLLELGMKTNNVNYVWLAAPLCGIFIHPMVGSYSDILHRRKPFIIIGSTCLFIFMLLFSNAKYIGKALHNPDIGLGFAICSVFCLDIGINLLMAPLRALASDTLDSSKQIEAMSWFSFFTGLAQIFGFLLGAVISDMRIVYAIGAVIILASCFATVMIVQSEEKNEEYVDKQQVKSSSTLCIDGMVNIYRTILTLPLFLWKLMHTQFWSCLGLVSMWMYLTDYWGENIMNGNVHSAEGSEQYNDYQLGVRYGNLGYTIQGIVILIVAYLSPGIATKCGMKSFWIFSFIVFGAVMCATPWITNLYLMMGLHGLTGMAFSSLLVYPWTIVTRYTSNKDNAGVLLTTYHLAGPMAALVTSFISGWIIDAFDGDVSSMLFVGGIGSFIAAFTIIFVDVHEEDEFEYLQVPQREMNEDDHLHVQSHTNDNEFSMISNDDYVKHDIIDSASLQF